MKEIIVKGELTTEVLAELEESFAKYLDVDDLTLKAYRCGIDSLMRFLKDNNIKIKNMWANNCRFILVIVVPYFIDTFDC